LSLPDYIYGGTLINMDVTQAVFCYFGRGA